MAQKVQTISDQKKNMKLNFPSEYGYGRNYFEFFLKGFLIDEEIEHLLEENYREVMGIGRVFTVDEKHKAFKGQSPHKTFAKGIWGHWITEGESTTTVGLPYLFCTEASLKEKRPITCENYLISMTNSEAFEEPDVCPMLCADAYYPSEDSLKQLRNDKIPFLVAINKTRMPELFEKMNRHIRKLGDWVVFRNSHTKEVASLVYFDDKLGRRMTLSNAFKYTKKDNVKLKNIIWDAYFYYMNTCDRFNHFLFTRYWPYTRIGWRGSYDDFYFASLLMNLYTLWHEHNHITDHIDNNDFHAALAKSIWSELGFM